MQDAFLVGYDKGIRTVLHLQDQPLVHGCGCKLGFKCLCEDGNTAGGQAGLFLAAVQPEEGKQRVEHSSHTVGGLADVPHVFCGFLRIVLFFYQPGVTHNGVQRGAQLMGDCLYRFLA